MKQKSQSGRKKTQEADDSFLYDAEEEEDAAPRQEQKISRERRLVLDMFSDLIDLNTLPAYKDDPESAGFKIKTMMKATFREFMREVLYKCEAMAREKLPMPEKLEDEFKCLRQIWKLVLSARDLLTNFEEFSKKPMNNEAKILRVRVGLGEWVKQVNDQCDRLMQFLRLEDEDGEEITEDAEGNIVDPYADGLLVMTFRELIDYAEDICLDVLDTKKPLDSNWLGVFNFLVAVWDRMNEMMAKTQEHSDNVIRKP